jgi:hypothetical protein
MARAPIFPGFTVSAKFSSLQNIRSFYMWGLVSNVEYVAELWDIPLISPGYFDSRFIQSVKYGLR